MKTRWGIAVICLAAVLGLPGFGNAEIKLFQETFFTQPTGQLYGDQEGSGRMGRAELGFLILVNGAIPSITSATVQQDAIAPGGDPIPGKSLRIYSEDTFRHPVPSFVGRVALPPAGAPYAGLSGVADANFMGYGRYVVSWTAECAGDGIDQCNQGFVQVMGRSPGTNGLPIFQLSYAGSEFAYIGDNGTDTTLQDDANWYVFPADGSLYQFRLGVNFTESAATRSLDLSILPPGSASTWTLAATPPLFQNSSTITSIESIVFSMSPALAAEGISETYYISNLKIVKLAVTGDTDGDRIEDGFDNCPNDPNPNQLDRNGDRVGDVCDPCPSTDCLPAKSPSGNVQNVTPDGLIEVCVNWPDVTDGPAYAFPPDCYNVHFVLKDQANNVLEPACRYPEAYDIMNGTVSIPTTAGSYCTAPCDLKERYPQLTGTDPLAGITISEIFYENFISDPWIDPTGACLDPAGCSDIWVGRINIPTPNDFTPTPDDDQFELSEDTALLISTEIILANDTDGDDDKLTVTSVFTQPQHGTVVKANAGNFTYTPAPDFNGEDSFTYQVTDGWATANATINITVTAVADIQADTALAIKGTAVTTDVLGNDSFEGLATVSAVNQGSNGSVVINLDNSVTYTPNLGFVGPDSYTYTVTSGDVTETAAVTIRTQYAWGGFLQPIDSNSINMVKAGRSIPIKFSLGGFQGMEVFETAYPKSVVTSCGAASGWVNVIDAEIGTPGGSGLTYDPATDQYSYVWKTSKSWKDCRQLKVKFADGSERLVVFEFK